MTSMSLFLNPAPLQTVPFTLVVCGKPTGLCGGLTEEAFVLIQTYGGFLGLLRIEAEKYKFTAYSRYLCYVFAKLFKFFCDSRL
jgi:hypothetical protein